ncbi:MAG: VanZ family protein [Candidatus Hydrogenedentota bacterium]
MRYKKLIDWLVALSWTIIIYITLPIGPDVIRYYTDLINNKNRLLIDYIHNNPVYSQSITEKLLFILNKINGYQLIGWFSAFIILCFLIYIYVKLIKLKRTLVEIILYFYIVIFYAYFLLTIKVPTEKIHFIEYGFLSYLLFRVYFNYIFSPVIYIYTIITGYYIGISDEIIQHILPNRNGAFIDVLWNGISVLLGTCIVIIINGLKSLKVKLEAKELSYVNLCVIVAILSTDIFLAVVQEYGYLHKFDANTYFYSRLSIQNLQRLDKDSYQNFANILNSSNDKNYEDFINKRYTSRRASFLHELRVHLFRRDRRFMQYLHYSLVKDRKFDISIIKNSEYRDYYYRYIQYYMKKEIVDDGVIKEYINILKTKTPKDEREILEDLFISYKEDKIVSNIFKNTYKNSIFYWGDSFVSELFKNHSLEFNSRFYKSPVSEDIITWVRMKEIWIYSIIIIIFLLVLALKYYKSCNKHKSSDTYHNP